MGKEPLRARLVFGGRHSNISIPFESDEDGAFEGELPRLGEWRLLVTAATPKLERELRVEVRRLPQAEHASLTVALGRSRISGEVVTEKGDPVAEGLIDLNVGGSLEQHRFSAGTFSIEGVEPGRVLLRAASGEGWSEPVTAHLTEDDDAPPVRLVVKRVRRLEGRVLDVTGRPIVGALVVQADPARYPFGAMRTRTDVEGAFSFIAPQGAPEAGLAVVVRGLPADVYSVCASLAGGCLDADLTTASSRTVRLSASPEPTPSR